MSRRSRKPGPLKEGPTASGRRLFVPGIAPWISVNPVPGGVLPTDVGGLTSDDIDNGTPGLWYYYDPNDTIDIIGHGSDWITQDSNGVEFYGVFDLLKDAKYSYNYSQGGRVSTCLLYTSDAADE